jgi:hypothetical protein
VAPLGYGVVFAAALCYRVFHPNSALVIGPRRLIDETTAPE